MVTDIPEITIELETFKVKDNRTWFQKLRMKLPWSRWKRSERKIMKAFDNTEVEHYIQEDAYRALCERDW